MSLLYTVVKLTPPRREKKITLDNKGGADAEERGLSLFIPLLSQLEHSVIITLVIAFQSPVYFTVHAIANHM